MTEEEKLEHALLNLIDSRVPMQTLPAQVTAVDTEKGTCDVEFLDKDLAPHKGVHLYAGLSTVTGLLPVPKLNSFVYVSIVQNNEQWAFVSLFTELDEIRLRGNALGGLVKIEPLISRLNALENDLNSLKTVFKSSWIVTPQDGGAALKTASASWAGSSIQTTKKSDIENTKVNHG